MESIEVWLESTGIVGTAIFLINFSLYLWKGKITEWLIIIMKIGIIPTSKNFLS
jgi:hypothetical protein